MKPIDHLRNRVAAQQSAYGAQAAALLESAERIRRANATLEAARTTIVPAGSARIAPRRTDPPVSTAAPAATKQIDPFLAAISRRFL